MPSPSLGEGRRAVARGWLTLICVSQFKLLFYSPTVLVQLSFNLISFIQTPFVAQKVLSLSRLIPFFLDETLVCGHSFENKVTCFCLKAIEQYFHVILFIMLYKVDLTFTSAVKP